MVSRFLISAWSDATKWPEEHALELVRWTVQELLPSPPKYMGVYGNRLAEFLADTVLTQALIQSLRIEDPKRANLAIRTLADALGMTDEEYMKSVVEVIDAI